MNLRHIRKRQDELGKKISILASRTSSEEDSTGGSSTTENITSGLRGFLSPRKEPVRKSYVHPDVQALIDEEEDDRARRFSLKVGENRINFLSKQDVRASDQGTLTKSNGRLSDPELKELAYTDPHIAAIINTRVTQVSAIAKKSSSKYAKGVRIKPRKSLERDKYKTQEEYEQAVERQSEYMDATLEWLMTCGTRNEELLDYIFAASDKDFRKCSLRDFFQSQVRNLATFGRCGTQLIRNRRGQIICFRPVPIETIKPVAPGEPIFISKDEDVSRDTLYAVNEYNATPEQQRPLAYVQEIDGRQVAFFTDKDLIVTSYQKQALFDLNGYTLSPIEFAMTLVLIHQSTMKYLRDQFVKGLLTKNILVFKSLDPTCHIGDAQLEQFKNDIQQYAMGTHGASTIPVIGGPVELQAVPLSPTPRDMEWLSVEQTVQRALLSAYQISADEVGWGQLGDTAGLNSGNKDTELVQGEERGLRILCDLMIEILEQVLSDKDSDFADEYQITYTGVGEETREAALERQMTEQNTTATFNSLLADSEKNEQLDFGGDVPLSQNFNTFVVPKMTYGEFREYFFKDKGAAQNPKYDFLCDPTLDQCYQACKTNMPQLNQQQMQMQLKQANHEMQMTEQQVQQQGQMGGFGDASQVGSAGGQPQSLKDVFTGAQQQKLAKSDTSQPSLRELYLNKNAERLAKSYVDAWNEWNEKMCAA